MLRFAVGLATRCFVKLNIGPAVSSCPEAIRQFYPVPQPFGAINRQFSGLVGPQQTQIISSLWPASQQLMENKPSVMFQQTRSVTKRSIKSGKRKTVKHVVRTFYYLNWGIWIRPRAGRHKRIWRKAFSRIRRAQNHVFCRASQSTMLNKMVTPFWRRPKYWVDDPYEPYHEREEYYMTRKKPRPPHNPLPEN